MLDLPAAASSSPDGRMSDRLFVHVGDGSATVKAGGLRLSIQPLLRFLARSPDGGPTILAPRDSREEREPRLKGTVRG
jgi:hypothetical protein